MSRKKRDFADGIYKERRECYTAIYDLAMCLVVGDGVDVREQEIQSRQVSGDILSRWFFYRALVVVAVPGLARPLYPPLLHAVLLTSSVTLHLVQDCVCRRY